MQHRRLAISGVKCEFLLSGDPHLSPRETDFKLRLLQDLYTGNPSLIPIRINQLYRERIPDARHQAAEDAKNHLLERLDMDKEYTRKEQRTAVHQILQKKDRPEVDNSSTSPSPPPAPAPLSSSFPPIKRKITNKQSSQKAVPEVSSSSVSIKSKTINKKPIQEVIPKVSSPSASIKPKTINKKPIQEVLPLRPPGIGY